MTEQSIGTARLDLVVDSTTGEAQLRSFERTVSTMSSAAQAEYNKLDSATKKYANSLIKQSDTLGLSRDQMIAYNAQLRIGGALGDEIAKKAQAQAQAQVALASAQERTAAIQAEATRRIQAETVAREKNWQVLRAQFADEQRLAQMRANATAAFGAELGARERATAAAQRQAGVNDRLNTLLATERGQRILAAQATNTHATALNRAAIASNAYGLSAKQQTAALRQVPMQITDIVTSLASGQRPLTVLIQQGGQLKDIFGGVVPAVRALGGALASLINPFTITAAAAAGLLLAWKQGSDEAVRFRQALALTGDVAGVTADELSAMSIALSQGLPTQHEAAAALAEVAKSGKFTGEQLREVAEAALAMERATGQAISETVSQFAQLRGDPVKAVQELNKTYHFLTLEVYEQIKALQAQGREEEALNLTISASSKALTTRANEVVQNASYMERAWAGLKVVVVGAWDAMRDAGRASTAITEAQMKIASANSELNAVSHRIKTFVDNGGIYSPEREKRDRAEIERLKKVKAEAARVLSSDPASKAADQRAALQRANEAAIALDGEAAGFESAIERLQKRKEKALGQTAEAVRLAQQAGNAELVKSIKEDGEKIVAALDKQIAEAGKAAPAPRVTPTVQTTPSRSLPELDTERAAQELERLAQAEASATESFRALEAQLQGPLAVAILDHERRVAELNALAEQSPVAAERLGAALELEAKRHQEVADSIKAAQDPMAALLADMKLELDLIGLSNAERAVMIELRRANIDVTTEEGKAVAEAALLTARAYDEEAKAKQRSIDLMDEFRSGASNALADIVTGAKSAKEAFADFFDDLARRITQMIAERWIEQAFGAMGTSGEGTQGGGWISSIFSLFASAKGNVFSGGQPVQAFANGGVVSGPTTFPMRGNRMGLMGEAGPEAIMPLKRGPDGRLGVEVASQAQRPVQNNYTTFYVPDLSSRRNQQQVADRTQRIQNRAAARN